MLQSQLAKTATPDLAIAIAELSSALGDATAAAQYFQMAEQIERAAWGNGSRQPQVLAKILSEQPGRAAEAVALAEEAARTRADIRRWIRWRGPISRTDSSPRRRQASAQALRTGTRNARIRCHAEEIDAAYLRHLSTVASAKVEGSGGQAISSARAPGATRRCLEWRP